MTTHKKVVGKMRRRMRTAKRKAHLGGTRRRLRPDNVNRNTARNNVSKIARTDIDPQMMFDKVMQFFLESVSAEDTLNSMGITRK